MPNPQDCPQGFAVVGLECQKSTSLMEGCGSNKFSDHKMNQPIDIILKHSGNSLKLVFGSELKHGDGECNGSFGVDDLEIYVR